MVGHCSLASHSAALVEALVPACRAAIKSIKGSVAGVGVLSGPDGIENRVLIC